MSDPKVEQPNLQPPPSPAPTAPPSPIGASVIMEPVAPYPGLRPYRREERHLFFGRGHDADLLSNQILAARLTLLFGQSGRGKSSLLRTLLIPRLESEGSRVFLFDAWAGADPIATLAEALAALIPAGEGRAADAPVVPGPGSSSGRPRRPVSQHVLLPFVRRLTAFDPRPLVLVLDQFEELLLRHGSRVGAICREVAALVRAAEREDLRVVISLREEFLAGLEPFRRDIPGLFDSTYRLEPLSPEAIREAITEPARAFGGEVEHDLVNRLVLDIEGGAETAETSRRPAGESDTDVAVRRLVGGTDVELPTLQLVLSQLWSAAASTGGHSLTVALYEKGGGAKGILQRYVAEVMPRSLKDRRLTARLLQHLAPPSGFKASFSAEDLAAIEAQPPARVQSELDRLAGAGILRLRTFRKQRLYELQHDALIDVLSPWRDEVLRSVRWRRTLFRSVAAVLLIASLGGGALYGKSVVEARQESREEDRITRTELDELRPMRDADPGRYEREAAQRFDAAARYMIFISSRPDRVERLARILESHRDVIPEDYGIRTGRFEQAYPPPEGWPFVIEHAVRRKLFGNATYSRLFRIEWQRQAIKLTAATGLPVPPIVDQQIDDVLQTDGVRFRVTSGASTRVKANVYEDRALLVRAEVKHPFAVEFLERLGSDAIALPSSRDLVVVPRWSLPVWKAVGEAAADGTAITVQQLIDGLQREPAPLLTSEAVSMLLERLSRRYPSTVAEARRIRGARLPDDLIEIVKRGRSIVNLYVVLDALASRPQATSQEIADELAQHPADLLATRSERAMGPGTGAADERAGSSAIIDALHQSVLTHLPNQPPPARVILGSRLFAATRNRERDLYETGAGWADQFIRRFGVTPPLPQLVPADETFPLGPDEFRLVLLDQTAEDAGAAPREPGAGQDPVRRVYEALDGVAASIRHRLVDAEIAKLVMDGAPERFGAWLGQHYAVSELKYLLRLLVQPDVQASGQGAAPGVETGQNGMGARSMRHAQWLLPALVYLHPRLGGRLPELAAQLQAIQARNMMPDRPSLDSAAVPARLESGITALLDDDLAAAEAAFGEPGADPRIAPEFVEAYAASFARWRNGRILAACHDLSRTALDRGGLRLDLEDAIDAAGSAFEQKPEALQLELCLYATYRKLERSGLAEGVLARILTRYPRTEAWSPEQAAWLAIDLLDQLPGSPRKDQAFELIRELLVLAVRRDPDSYAVRRFLDVKAACRRSVSTWCSRLSDAMVEVRPNELALYRAEQLTEARYRAPADGRAALQLIETIESRVRASPKDWAKVLTLESLDYVKLCALLSAGADGSDDAWMTLSNGAKATISALRTHTYRTAAGSCFADVLRHRRMFDVFADLNQERLVGDVSPETWLTVALAAGDRGLVTSLTREYLRSGNSTTRFAAAIGSLAARVEEWQETTRGLLKISHPFRDLVRIILAATLEGEEKGDGLAPLDERWRSVDPAGWEARFADGDPQAWYEMLLGVFLAKPSVDEAAIVGALTDDVAFAASPLAHLPFVRKGLLCEFYFYRAMRARLRGNGADLRADLQRTVDTGYGDYSEYAVARFLLANPDLQ